MEKSRVYIGDSREVLPSLKEELEGKIALMVTSPPYFVGREYEEYIDSFEDYWQLLTDILKELDPLIEPYGKVAVNFADKYANSKHFGRPFEISYIPRYVSIMEEYLSYDLWARFIWDKVRVMIDGARHTTNKSRFNGDMRAAPNWEHIYVWRKRSKGKRKKKEVDMTYQEWRSWVDSIWEFSSVRKNPRVGGTKLAIFPNELPHRLIKMYTEPNDVIIDPFCGTGTTVLEAMRLGRVGIGIEKNPGMKELLKQNLQDEAFANGIAEIIDYG